ncbi:putative amidoligase domain-containing protein [Paenibacillus sp. CAU 1782]
MGELWVWDGTAYESMMSEDAPRRLPLNKSPRQGDVVLPLTWSLLPRSSKQVGIWLLNEGASSLEDMSLGRQRELWRMSGLGVAEGLPDERLFVVEVCNLEPLSVMRAENGVWQKTVMAMSEQQQPEKIELKRGAEPKIRGYLERKDIGGTGQQDSGGAASWRSSRAGEWPSDAALRRVARVAVRALYVLRLDIGEAVVALAGDGRCAVRGVRPLLGDGASQSAALRRFAAMLDAAGAIDEGRRILLGADPEFVLLMPSGKVAPASRFFGAGAGGAAGADAVLVGRRLLYPVAELRPAPAEGPAALAGNIRRLMLAAAAKVRDPRLRWVAGAMPVPGLALGGHIHISGAPLTSRLLRLLDNCAAYPLAMVEDPAGRGRRPRYGSLGDFRLQPHGGFEYRTLPSWLVSPAAAKAAFALALLCAREAATLPRIPAAEERYRAAYYAGDRKELSACLDDIADVMTRCASYEELAPFIEPLFQAARAGKTWDEQSDFRLKWRIPFPQYN